MKLPRILALCGVALVLLASNEAFGQVVNATAQNASPRVVASRSAPVTAAKPGSVTRVAPQVQRPIGLNPQRFNPNVPRTIAQPAINPQRTYSPPVRGSNPGLVTPNAQRGGPIMQQPVSVDPVTRQTELRTLEAMRQRRGVVTRDGNILDPATRQNGIHTVASLHGPHGVAPGQANLPDAATRDTELRTLKAMRGHHGFKPDNQTLATVNPQRHIANRDPEGGSEFKKHEKPKDGHGKKWHNKKDRISHGEAFRRHWHEWHDRNWWHDHCDTIVYVTTGYYFLDGSYWYPAYGYDPLQSYYDYDGPIYTYSNLLPDEVIANVQTALQDAGYYYGEITGSLGVDTRAAIANFQRDYGLQITGAIDEDTVEALGLY